MVRVPAVCLPLRFLKLQRNTAARLKVGKVNVDEQIEVAMKFNITSIPTVMVFKNGNPAATSVGFCAKEQLEEMIK